MKTKRKCKKPHPCITQARLGKAQGSVLMGNNPPAVGEVGGELNPSVPGFYHSFKKKVAADVHSKEQKEALK